MARFPRTLTNALGALALFGICQAQAAIIATDLGTAAPPGTLGGFAITPFGPDGLSNFINITSLASPLGGSLGFSSAVNTRSIGAGWATWSHGYTGDVYYSNGATSLGITLPADTAAFYLYAEPNPFATFLMTATADDGTFLTASVAGSSGANGFGFHGTGGTDIVSVTISSTVDFAVGEFGIAQAQVQVPEPATLALVAIALLGLGAARRRAA